MRADRVSRVVDSDWIIRIVSVLRMISGAVFHILGIYAMAPKRKWKFNEDWKRDFAWIAKTEFVENGAIMSGNMNIAEHFN